MSFVRSSRAGFFTRHWRGEFSLHRSYWVHTLPLTLLLPYAGLFAAILVAGQQARYISMALLAGLLLATLLLVWALGGTLRSSLYHRRRGGSLWYAWLVRLLNAVCIFYVGFFFVISSDQLYSYWQLALGRQPSEPYSLSATADGRAIHITGGMNDGVAKALAKMLGEEPNVKTIMFDSGGGWVREGMLLANVIRMHHLNTYVEGDCNSACTIAFLAGADRALAPGGRLGFHRFRSVGEAASNGSDDAVALRAYRQSGVGEHFITQIVETPDGEIWYPSPRELMAASVITRISSGGELALASTRFKTRDDLKKELLHDKVFVIVANRFPDRFDALVDNVWTVSREHVSDARLVTTARDQLQALYQQELPGAPDSVFRDIGLLQLDQAKYLQKENVLACSQLLDRRVQSDTRVYWPSALSERERGIMRSVLETGSTQAPPAASPDAIQNAFTLVHEQMTPEMAALLNEDSEARSGQPEQTCKAIVSYLKAVNSLPFPERPLLLRLIYTPRRS